MPYADSSLPDLLERLPSEAVRQFDEEDWVVQELSEVVLRLSRPYPGNLECRLDLSFRPDGDLQSAVSRWEGNALVAEKAFSSPPKNVANLMDVALVAAQDLMFG